MQVEYVELLLNGEPRKVAIGTRISELLEPSHGVSMVCGGRGTCRKCRVRAWGGLSPLSPEERETLTEKEQAAGLRLACCSYIQGPCRIVTDLAGRSRICAEGVMPNFTWQPTFSTYGAAIDVGTTTLALHLYDRHSLLAEVTAPNPQSVFGGDVISRITRALEGEGPTLADSIRQGLADLLYTAATRADIPVTAIDRVVITGNTTMLYLLTERDVSCLSRAPFVADHLFGHTVSATALKLPCTEAEIYLAPCISAFVGGDITTSLLASGIHRTKKTALLADIGTNGELALWHNGVLRCCSTAAGPAFEGAGLSMGMAGESGAIDRLSVVNGRLFPHVIDEIPPIGLCGSGVIDAVACLLDLEQLDETGLLEEDPTVLAGDVSLTGKDIRMVQLAKGAVRAGMETLLHHAGISAAELEQLAVAGGFGSYMDVRSAMRIGLLPTIPTQRVQVLGNAALAGAAMLLLDPTAAGQAVFLAAEAQTANLAVDSIFQEKYMEAMFFAY